MSSMAAIILVSFFGNILAVSAAPATSQVDPNFFPGVQTGLGSWFRANNRDDHTVGHSWCNYEYHDDDLIFAPCLKAMGGATYYTDKKKWKESIAKYCGLEAKVTDPSTGKSMLLYVGDSFEDAYCRGPGWIDIMIGPFKQLHGDPKGNKNYDINNVHWELTGKKNPRYSAP
ncbi:hypothetical protein AC579_2624 [Pseudocercospora musae]|uniref:Ecp2 effector protein domain-containing protein n=1 Tax=Pseudocercospora musae TaxID=113226 RepID=A0A139IGT1_9PEZI|nr:hypothetical protein AC579_2624 [Pseudocercospora musae]